MGAGLGDHGAAVGVADQQDVAVDAVEHGPHRRRIAVQVDEGAAVVSVAGQVDRDDVRGPGPAAGRHPIPAPGPVPRAVHQHDRRAHRPMLAGLDVRGGRDGSGRSRRRGRTARTGRRAGRWLRPAGRGRGGGARRPRRATSGAEWSTARRAARPRRCAGGRPGRRAPPSRRRGRRGTSTRRRRSRRCTRRRGPRPGGRPRRSRRCGPSRARAGSVGADDVGRDPSPVPARVGAALDHGLERGVDPELVAPVRLPERRLTRRASRGSTPARVGRPPRDARPAAHRHREQARAIGRQQGARLEIGPDPDHAGLVGDAR